MLEEYVQGEKWIQSIIEQIKPEWVDIQKLAFIDNQIGKKISYSPSHGTEVENKENEKCVWRIISTGYGICDGISALVKYILKKVKIDSEIISGGTHKYLKIKNIEIPTNDGMIKGDTLLDPTWNLAAHRFGCMPSLFCVTYNEVRKADFEEDGKDSGAHRNNQLEEKDAKLIKLDNTILRQVFRSIGLTNESGKFPATQLCENIKEIERMNTGAQDQLANRFKALKNYYPEFAECMNSTIKILQSIVLEHSENFNYENCISSRVYRKDDIKKQPVLFVYFDFGTSGKIFFYADNELKTMIPTSQEEFESLFECYEYDKRKNGYNKIWEGERQYNINNPTNYGI